MRLRFGFVLLLLGLGACQFGTPLPANTGHWSDARFWASLNLQKPSAGDVVTIPAGSRVILDQDPPPLRGIRVQGELEFARKNLHLTTGYLKVLGPGRLRIGTEVAPFTQRAVITLTGEANSVSGACSDGMGARFLGAMMGARLEIIGEDRVAWTKLGASAPAGSTQITLAEPVDWRVGEQIVIASSALDPHQAETRTILGIAGNTLTLDRALEYGRFGELQTIAGQVLDQRAAVGLLSRNIVIQGDEKHAGGFGGHVIVMGSSPTRRETDPALRSSARVRGVEFRRLGQFDQLGRYPFHWHLNGPSAGDYLINSSFHSNFQRGIVVHGTDQVLVKNNVLYNTLGHSISTEDGSEVDNRFVGNLSVLTRAFPFRSSDPGQVEQGDHRAATFWIRGPNNRFVGNVAAGGDFFAFWFDNPGAVDQSRFEFSDNVMHSYLLGQALGAPGSVDDRGALYISGSRTQPTTHGPFVLRRSTIYHTRSAMWASPAGHPAGEARVELRNSILADNAIGTGSHGLRDSVIVGRSANPFTPAGFVRTGVLEYGGLTSLINVAFVNFPTGTSALRSGSCLRASPKIISQNIQLHNAQFGLCASGSSDLAIWDMDGSLAGSGPSTIVPSSTEAMHTAACSLNTSANARVCPGHWQYFNLTLQTNVPFIRGSPGPDLIRDDGQRQSGHDLTSAPFYWTLIEGHTYTLDTNLAAWQFMRLQLDAKYSSDDPTPRSTHIVLGSTTADFGVYSCSLDNQQPGTNCADRTPLTSKPGLAELDAATQPAYFHDSTAQRIHLKLFSNTSRSLLIER
jgi:hypothetical protein